MTLIRSTEGNLRSILVSAGSNPYTGHLPVRRVMLLHVNNFSVDVVNTIVDVAEFHSL